MSRGTDQWNIFLDDPDRLRFLALVGKVAHRYAVEVAAFCLMGNHFHLVLYCTEPNLSAAMRDLKASYARSFNRRHGRSGPLFGAPFVAKPILDDGYLTTAVRYVHRNPLDRDPLADLAAEQWSSHGIYLGLRPTPLWMHTTIVRNLFGAGYREIVEQPQAADKVQNRIVRDPGSRTIQPLRTTSIAEVLIAVAQAASVDLAEIRPRVHNGLIGVAALLAIELGSFSASELAEPLGLRSVAAVHKQTSRTRQRIRPGGSHHRIYQDASLLLTKSQAA